MAGEAVIIELLGNKGDVVRYACNSTDVIAKGQLLVFDDLGNRKISGANLVGAAAAGIAVEEKLATTTNQLFIGVYTNGLFDVRAGIGLESGNIGTQVVISGANYVNGATDAYIMSGMVLGRALEFGTTNAETIAVKVKT